MSTTGRYLTLSTGRIRHSLRALSESGRDTVPQRERPLAGGRPIHGLGFKMRLLSHPGQISANGGKGLEAAISCPAMVELPLVAAIG